MIDTIAGIMGTAFLAVLGWAYTLSNRVLVIETNYQGLEDLINARFEEVNRRLDQIEDKL